MKKEKIIERIEKDAKESEKLITQMEMFGFKKKAEYFKGRKDALYWVAEYLTSVLEN